MVPVVPLLVWRLPDKGHMGELPFFSSMVTVSLVHFIKNLVARVSLLACCLRSSTGKPQFAKIASTLT
jgi:hypothetical protein